MDQSNQNKPSAPRKMKFAPKAPKRQPKVEVKPEPVEDTDAIQAKELLQRFQQSSLLKSKPKVERKFSASQTASTTRSYSFPKSEFGGISTPALKKEKEYVEPWDHNDNYPITLPLRRPYSGDPEVLNEEEFGEAAVAITSDENLTKPAEELGLLEENLEPTMFFVQLPRTLPMIKKSATAEEQKVNVSSRPPGRKPSKEKATDLDELPAGLVGKLQVYKSGAVKLKIGDTIFDVSAGSDCSLFAQDVVAINTKEKHCCLIGELDKRMILTPDVDSVLDSMVNDLKF